MIFVAFDSEPEKIRARMSRRDNTLGDDFVEVTLDTFHDQRRGYMFISNPFGIQTDALWTEGGRGQASGPGPGPGQGNVDPTFDTLWYSRGQLTDQGYVVWMAIPFKSLRFPTTDRQNWGVTLLRTIPRQNEWSYWPRVSSRIEGRLNQAGTILINRNLSLGRNFQLIPFGLFRSFRALDTRDPQQPRFLTDRVDPDLGLDSKFVFKDSLVLDVAVNPDFSQVESDQPQVTVNRRFEVLFPEKRPFFLENSNFFRTPINLVFTRRIADPQFGIRLTGKTGPYAIGAMLIDDESPGKGVPDTSLLAGKRAHFGILRVSRDISVQSTLGFTYTHRQFEDSFNRVAGMDGRFKLDQNWVASFQAATSWARFLEASQTAGPAYFAELKRSGRQFSYNFQYEDLSPGFLTQPGFVLRNDIRRIQQLVNYRFRPEGEHLIAWGPILRLEQVWDHAGTRLDWIVNPRFTFEFTRQTRFGIFYRTGRERIRPQDFTVLTGNQDFSVNGRGFFVNSDYFSKVGINGRLSWGKSINFVPSAGKEPRLAKSANGDFGLRLRPITPLRIDNTYLFGRLVDRTKGGSIFNNHIVRSRWNWQFSREMSMRVILQYNATLSNQELTALPTTKNFNADFLFTYLVNPWTVLFIGYNTNAQNIDLVPTENGTEIVRTRSSFQNDSRQFFVKFSYLFRF